jgi:hypothetical protein
MFLCLFLSCGGGGRGQLFTDPGRMV